MASAEKKKKIAGLSTGSGRHPPPATKNKLITVKELLVSPGTNINTDNIVRLQGRVGPDELAR